MAKYPGIRWYPEAANLYPGCWRSKALLVEALRPTQLGPGDHWWPLLRVTADSIRRFFFVKTPWELRTSCDQIVFALAGWLALVIRTLSEDVKRMSKGDAILSCIILCRNVPVHAALLGAVAVSGNAKVVVWGWVLSGTTWKATEMWCSIVQLGRDFARTTASVQHAPWPPWDETSKRNNSELQGWIESDSTDRLVSGLVHYSIRNPFVHATTSINQNCKVAIAKTPTHLRLRWTAKGKQEELGTTDFQLTSSIYSL